MTRVLSSGSSWCLSREGKGDSGGGGRRGERARREGGGRQALGDMNCYLDSKAPSRGKVTRRFLPCTRFLYPYMGFEHCLNLFLFTFLPVLCCLGISVSVVCLCAPCYQSIWVSVLLFYPYIFSCILLPFLVFYVSPFTFLFFPFYLTLQTIHCLFSLPPYFFLCSYISFFFYKFHLRLGISVFKNFSIFFYTF